MPSVRHGNEMAKLRNRVFSSTALFHILWTLFGRGNTVLEMYLSILFVGWELKSVAKQWLCLTCSQSGWEFSCSFVRKTWWSCRTLHVNMWYILHYQILVAIIWLHVWFISLLEPHDYRIEQKLRFSSIHDLRPF